MRSGANIAEHCLPYERLALPQSIWSHRFFQTGLVPAPKFKDVYHTLACQLNHREAIRLGQSCEAIVERERFAHAPATKARVTFVTTNTTGL